MDLVTDEAPKAKRVCHGERKAGGPCGANPIRPGTLVGGVAVSGDWCIHHDPDLPESARIGGRQPGAGRPAVPRHTDVARRLVEENIVAVQRPYWRALGFDVEIGPNGPQLVTLEDGGAKLYGTSKTGTVRMSAYDDLGAMMQASERLQDRTFGRPRQALEVSGPDGDPISTSVILDGGLAREARDLLRRAAATRDE